MFEITFNSLEQHKKNSNQKEDPVNHENLGDHFWNLLNGINSLSQDSGSQKSLVVHQIPLVFAGMKSLNGLF